MYNIEEIKEIFSEIIPFLKDQSDKNKKSKRENEPYKGYFKIVDRYNHIKAHSEVDYFPEWLFVNRAPNETDEELKYRRANFKQVTMPVYTDLLNTVYRAVHNSSWSIEYKEDEKLYEENSLREYVENDIYMYESLKDFYMNIVPPLKLNDPHGVVVTRPYNIQYKQLEDESFIIDDQELLEPIPYYYSCERIMGYVEDKYALIELDEKSLITKDGKQSKTGYVFEFHDTESYWQIRQIGKHHTFQFEFTQILKHNWGQMLVNELKGIPTCANNKINWISPFSYAVDNLDIVLLDSSNLFIGKAKGAYPIRVMLGNECEFEENGNRCTYGVLYLPTKDGLHAKKECPQCHGTGLKNRISPQGELMWNAKDLGDQNVNANQLLQYVAPSREILDFLQDQIDRNTEIARRILHLSSSSDKANSNSETATFNNLENKALIAFIAPISYQIFDLYAWGIDAVGYLRYGDKYKRPIINRPSTFDFTTEKDYLELLKLSKESNLPSSVIRYILYKYITSIYFNTKESAKVFELMLDVDRLFEFTNEDIANKMASGTVFKWEEILHTSSVFFIENLIKKDPEFLEKDIEEQRQLIINEAKLKEQELKNSNSAVNDVLA